jgi:hypothetical protein
MILWEKDNLKIYLLHKKTDYIRKATTRDRSGNVAKAKIPAGSFAEEKQKYLAEQRKLYNVDHLGRYRGGVPQKGRINFRGKSLLGPPGTLHDPDVVNWLNNKDPDFQFISPEEALQFKVYMNEDKYDIQKRWPWFEAEIDYEYFRFNLYRYGLRFLRNLFIVAIGIGFVVESTFRSWNRKALKFAVDASKHHDLKAGIEYNGKKIVQTPQGVIKYA